MAMNISGSYGGSYANTLSDVRKESEQPAKVRIDTVKNSRDSVDEYYEKLCKKFPHITININGSIMMGNDKKLVLNLSKECLKKMTEDPVFAKKMENDISGIPEGTRWLYNRAKSDGKKVLSCALILNDEGGMQGVGKIVRVNDTDKSAGMLNVKNGTKDKLDKIWEKNLEKHREEAERIEKAQEEKREKEDYMKKLLEKYSSAVNTYDAMGYETENTASASAINKQI